MHTRTYRMVVGSALGGLVAVMATGQVKLERPGAAAASAAEVVDIAPDGLPWVLSNQTILSQRQEAQSRGTPNYCFSCLGRPDIDQDRVVGLGDLQLLLAAFGTTCSFPDVPPAGGTGPLPPCVECEGDTESVPGEIRNLETCEDIVNGGCFEALVLFDEMQVGVPMCGATNRSAGDIHTACWDLDWFLIEIPHTDWYSFELWSDWGGFGVITSEPFEDPESFCAIEMLGGHGALTESPCGSDTSIFTLLSPGTYVVLVTGQFAQPDTVGNYRAIVKPTCFSCAGPADLDSDGVVGLDDLQLLLFAFGTNCN